MKFFAFMVLLHPDATDYLDYWELIITGDALIYHLMTALGVCAYAPHSMLERRKLSRLQKPQALKMRDYGE